MRKFILSFASLCAMALLISASPVHAQNVLWVAASGSDGNVCSQTNPCATFQGAINKGSVAQINCLTSGSYGPFTVTASIIVDCGTGNVGNVVVNSNAAIVLNAAAPATVVLRHLSVNGLGLAVTGISTAAFHSGSLIVEDCTFQGFPGGYGIFFAPVNGRGLLQVSNTRIVSNGSGINVSPGNGQIASLTLNSVELAGNANLGLAMTGSIVAGTMRDSVVGANGTTGIFANASQVYFTVEESSIVANLTYGIRTFTAGSVVNVGRSTIGGNGTGVKADAGSLISFGNNQMSANGANGTFTATVPQL